MDEKKVFSTHQQYKNKDVSFSDVFQNHSDCSDHVSYKSIMTRDSTVHAVWAQKLCLAYVLDEQLD